MSKFESIERAIEVIRAGGMVVMVDDEDRENEGDLVVAAEHCSAASVNFMCKEGRGLICLSLTGERVEALGLPMMVPTDPGCMGTAFTVSIEAREGVTTGISAADRARTIAVACDEACGPKDIVSPGHIFPLRAQRGGVLVRSGHTEGSIDIARLAGCRPAAVICEIMRDDGEMARMDDLEGFARKHDLPVISIADLIEYRLKEELLIEEIGRAPFASPALGIREDSGWTVHKFRSMVVPHVYFMVLVKGDLRGDEPVLLRAQTAQVLGDVFGFANNDSATRIRQALARIDREGRGVFLYVLGDRFGDDEQALKIEGGGKTPGLKARESGFRNFGLGAQVLKFLGVRSIRVVTNHPRKIVGLEGFGIGVEGHVPLTED